MKIINPAEYIKKSTEVEDVDNLRKVLKEKEFFIISELPKKMNFSKKYTQAIISYFIETGEVKQSDMKFREEPIHRFIK